MPTHAKKTNKNKLVKPSRVGRRQVSTWVLPDAARQLRILAAEQGKSQQALIAEALNLLFAKYGKRMYAEEE
jgi:hypothetical protein